MTHWIHNWTCPETRMCWRCSRIRYDNYELNLCRNKCGGGWRVGGLSGTWKLDLTVILNFPSFNFLKTRIRSGAEITPSTPPRLDPPNSRKLHAEYQMSGRRGKLFSGNTRKCCFLLWAEDDCQVDLWSFYLMSQSLKKFPSVWCIMQFSFIDLGHCLVFVDESLVHKWCTCCRMYSMKA